MLWSKIRFRFTGLGSGLLLNSSVAASRLVVVSMSEGVVVFVFRTSVSSRSSFMQRSRLRFVTTTQGVTRLKKKDKDKIRLRLSLRLSLRNKIRIN